MNLKNSSVYRLFRLLFSLLFIAVLIIPLTGFITPHGEEPEPDPAFGSALVLTSHDMAGSRVQPEHSNAFALPKAVYPARYTNVISDLSRPVITGVSLAPDNSYIDVTFSEGVYSTPGNPVASGALDAADFNLILIGGVATNLIVTAATDTQDSPLNGGETVVRVHFITTGIADGRETLVVELMAVSVYSLSGAIADADQHTHNVTNLNDLKVPAIVSLTSPSPNGTYGIGAQIFIEVNFDEILAGGDFLLPLETGRTPALLARPVIEGNKAIFEYVVLPGEETLGLNTIGLVPNLALPVTDFAGNISDLVIPPGNSLIDNANLIIDGVAPILAPDLNSNFEENGTGTAHTVAATDITSLTYSLGSGNDEAFFNIDANSGEVTFKVAPDFENPADANEDNDYVISVIVIDAAGNASGQDVTITVTDKVDETAPTISSISLAPDNSYVDVTFSEGVYNTNGASGALDASDFNLSLSGGTANTPVVSNVKTTGDQTLSGGETTIRVYFTKTETANGSETLEVDLVVSSVFDAAANPADADQSSNNTVSLNDKTSPVIASISLAPNNSYVDVTFSEDVYNTNGGSGALDASDFNLSLSGGTANTPVVSSVKTTGDQALSGGETIIRVNFAVTGIADGSETLEVDLVASSVFDAAGNAADAAQAAGNTVNLNLELTTLPVFTSTDIATVSEDISGTVLDVNANDGSGGADDNTVTYGLSGDDSGAFSIDASGLLTFNSSLNFDNPGDKDVNNIYSLTITASNDFFTAEQEVCVIVLPTITETVNQAVQIGQSVTGENAGDLLGGTVVINALGTVMAVSENGFDFAGFTSVGRARVFKRNATGDWEQLGQALEGTEANKFLGRSLSLNGEGNMLAVGSSSINGSGIERGLITVYKFNSGSSKWEQIGQDFEGPNDSDRLGADIRLNMKGNVLAIGVSGTNNGHVEVYELNEAQNDWVQLGSDIVGEKSNDASGGAVSLSADGHRVAIGASGNDGAGNSSGHLRIYEWDGTSWTQLGSDINGEAATDQAGGLIGSVNMSADGSTVALGARLNDGGGTSSGHARVFRWNGSSWSKLGSDINGESSFDLLYHVSLSADGNTLALGATTNDGGGSNSGHVRVFQYTGSSWSKKREIHGENSADQMGPLMLSMDGSVLATGSTGNDDNGSGAGHARVFKLFEKSLVFTSGTLASFVEGQTGTVLDVNANDGFGIDDLGITYSLTQGGDNDSFSISNDGLITFNNVPDFEAPLDDGGDNTYVIEVNATDGNESIAQTITISVTDLSVAPLFVSDTSTDFDENATGTVYTAEALVESGTIVYGLGTSNDESLFQIDASSGAITFNSSPDFETAQDANTDNIYVLEVIATLNAESASQTVSIAVNDVDEIAPAISSVSVPSDQVYSQGRDMDFMLITSEVVTVNTDAGSPTLELTIGNDTKQASFIGGSGTDALFFRYETIAGDEDTDGIAVVGLNLNGSLIKDDADNDLLQTLNNVASTSAVLVDAVAPTILSITSSNANGTYGIGEEIDIVVTFSEPVQQDIFPSLELETGTTDRTLFNFDGEGTDTWVFTYTVQFEDHSADLELTGSRIDLGRDLAGNSTDLTLPTGANSLSGSKNLVIDAVDPVIGGTLTPIINFEENSKAVVYTMIATDDTDLTYSFDTGSDEVLFDINSSTGVITFKSAPDFEDPLDTGEDNTYLVDVIVTDAVGNSSLQSVMINVTDIADEIAPFFDPVDGDFSTGLNPNLNQVDIPFNEGVFGGSGSDPVDASDIALTLSNNTTVDSPVITSVTNTSDEALKGGESTLRVNFSFNGNALGGEVLTFSPVADAIFDAAGNAADVDQTPDNTIVLKDITAPTVIIQNVTVYLDENGNASISTSDINNGTNDNAGLASLGLNNASFKCEDIGENIVTFTATDINGNSASADATVTVADDIKPVAITKDITVFLDAEGAASITPDDINDGSSDNCSISVLDLDKNNFTADDLGEHVVTLTVTDLSGNSATSTATVNVVDSTDPQITSDQTAVFEENSTAVAYTIVATDITPIAYSLGSGNDEALFTLDSSTGSVRFIESPDFESPQDGTGDGSSNTYVIKVIATDAGGNAVNQDVTITVTDADEIAPFFDPIGNDFSTGLNPNVNQVDIPFNEGVFGGSGSGPVDASDFTLTLSNNTTVDSPIIISITDASDQPLQGGESTLRVTFGYNGTALGDETLTFNPVADAIFDVAGNTASTAQTHNSLELHDETVPTVNITFGSSGTRGFDLTYFFDLEFSEGVQGVSDDDFTATFATSASPITVSTEITETNSDNLATKVRVSTSFLLGTGESNTITLDVKSNAIFDAANLALAQTSFTSTERVDEVIPGLIIFGIDATNTQITGAFTEPVYGDDVASAPVEASDLALSVSGGTATAATITSITNANGEALAGGAEGVLINIAFTGTPNGDETITVEASDNASVFDFAGHFMPTPQGGGNTARLSDIYGPVFTSGTSTSFVENATGTVYTATATDLGGFSFKLGSDADEALFTIDKSTGELTFVSSPDFENPQDGGGNNNYEVEITASDGSNVSSQTITISVTDIDDEKPLFTSSTSVSFEENETGTVYTANATDVDSQTITYTLSNSNDTDVTGLFNLDANSGLLTFKEAQDFETAAGNASSGKQFLIDIIASDEANNETTLALTISLIDLNEAPVVSSNPITTINDNEFYEYFGFLTDPDERTAFNALNAVQALELPSWLSLKSRNPLFTQLEVEDDEGESVPAEALAEVDYLVRDSEGNVIMSVFNEFASELFLVNSEGVLNFFDLKDAAGDEFELDVITAMSIDKEDNLYFTMIGRVSTFLFQMDKNGTVTAVRTDSDDANTNELPFIPEDMTFDHEQGSLYFLEEDGRVHYLDLSTFELNGIPSSGEDNEFDNSLIGINDQNQVYTYLNGRDALLIRYTPGEEGFLKETILDSGDGLSPSMREILEGVEDMLFSSEDQLLFITRDEFYEFSESAFEFEPLNNLELFDTRILATEFDGLRLFAEANGTFNYISRNGLGELIPGERVFVETTDPLTVGHYEKVLTGKFSSETADFSQLNSISSFAANRLGHMLLALDDPELVLIKEDQVFDARFVLGDGDDSGDSPDLGRVRVWEILGVTASGDFLLAGDQSILISISPDDLDDLFEITEVGDGPGSLIFLPFTLLYETEDVETTITDARLDGDGNVLMLLDDFKLVSLNPDTGIQTDLINENTQVEGLSDELFLIQMEIDAVGNIFLVDIEHEVILKLDKSGVLSILTDLPGVNDLTISGNNQLYASTIERLFSISADGTATALAGQEGSVAFDEPGTFIDGTGEEVQFIEINAIQIDESVGFIYILDDETLRLALLNIADFALCGEAEGQVGVHNVSLKITDLGDTEISLLHDFTITVLDVTPPSITSGSDAVIDENSTDDILSITAEDNNSNAVLSYTLSGEDADLFAIDPNDQGLTFIAAPDFENPEDDGEDNVYNLTLEVKDDAENSTSQELTITVSDLDDEAPVFTSSNAISIDENETAVITLTATDADAGSTLSFSLTGGADQALFGLTGADLSLLVAEDYENPTQQDQTYEVEVTVTDGTNDTQQTITVSINDLNDEAPVFTSVNSLSVIENSTATGYTAMVTDIDSDDASFSLGTGNDEALFNIDPNTGELTFITPPDFESPGDNGADNAYVIEVTANDGMNEAKQAVTITVTDVDEILPVFSSGTLITFDENDNSLVQTVVATDANTLTYGLGAANDEALFNIDPNTGDLAFITPPDFETPADADTDNNYIVEVTADDGLNVASQTITITIRDIDEILPVFTSASAVNFAENGSGTAYTIAATDANVLTYGLGTGNDEASFGIDPISGKLNFVTAPDFETPADADTDNAYVVEVTANDGTNEVKQTVIITVTDIDEILPVFTSGMAVNFAENGTGTAYTIAATDANALTFALGKGNDESLFDISGGVVTFKNAPDFEAPGDADTNNDYVIEVQASDGLNTASQTVTITVTDVQEDVTPPSKPVITGISDDTGSSNSDGVTNDQHITHRRPMPQWKYPVNTVLFAAPGPMLMVTGYWTLPT